MTAEKSNWNYDDLSTGVATLENEIRYILRNHANPLTKTRAEKLRHTIDFIEYNMKEMEITGGNGD